MRALIVLLLEGYAVALALLQYVMGVRTDEAKYLLNIPYPHPPLARVIVSSLDFWTYQELFWRIVFASLLVQAVWFVWDMGRSLQRPARIALCTCYVLSAAVLLQAGSIMMAVLTALQELLLLWLLLRPRVGPRSALGIALLWLVSLLCAYQAVLFAPLVWVLLRETRRRLPDRVVFFVVPLLVLAIYSFSNPLSLQSMVNHAGKDIGDTMLQRIAAFLHVWALGGSIVLSIVGTWGIFKSRHVGLIGSFVLLCAFILLSRYDYYAILFTPLFCAGALSVLKQQRTFALPLAVATVLGTALLLFWYPPSLERSAAREVLQAIGTVETHGIVLINGNFGHEWQYESRFEIRRFNAELLSRADAVVCLSACPAFNTQEWRALAGAHATVWVHR
jgi:hypothetical protein